MADSFFGEAGSGIEDANDASGSGNGVDITETNTTETSFIGAEDTSAKARKKKAQVPHEFMKRKNLFSGPLLPSEFRAPTKGGDSEMEHPQTVLLSKVLQANISLGNAYTNNLQSSRVVVRLWMDLQQSKEGMVRQKMMGKKVNFACRSVISPDPYLAVNEIGIPPYFALRLTYPEGMTPWNIVKLREAIINGGSLMQPGKNFDYEIEGNIVLRHLQDGDVVLVNRQPTLHKPSIMAHVVRVLKGEKTIRMHYANCSTYNADFDGDEINVNFPQDEISRAEAYNIVNANNQYVRPSNGEPIRALIQDHIVSSVLLTKRDTFLSRDEFNHLLYSSGVSSLAKRTFSGKPAQKVFVSSSEEGMLSILPAILKPKPLWIGKQVMLNHITRGHPPFTVEKTGKIPHDFFKNRSNENKPKNDGKYDEKHSKKEPDEEKILTLPCFHPWDWAARAGLVDTAVKTSRSGYLQRCLIKNLECLKISYDHTVRDADGSIVQFDYGEDEKLSSKLGEPDDSGKILHDGLSYKAVQFIKNNRYQKIKPKDFLKLLNLKFLSSLAQPGEPVGVLAAQCVG
ncbi:hypothetical protein CRYUN_Cryun11dG0000200 [Craigia yunnanensis]